MTAKKSHTLSLLTGAALALALTAGCGGKAPAAGSWEIDGPTPTPPVYWAQVQNRTVYALDRDITLEVPGDAQALLHELEAMRALETVTFTGGVVDNETQDRLRAARPDLTFRCDTQLLGRAWPWDTTTLSLAGEARSAADLDTLRENLFRLPHVKTVDLTGCGLSGETLHALDEALGEIDVVWNIPLYGLEFPSNSEEIDLSGTPVGDGGEALEAALPWFSHLNKVVMCDCGVGNEEMDALNKKHEDIRFVWAIHFSIWTVRTDATNFICNRTYNRAPLYSAQCRDLRYCTDLIALDLGHKDITDLDFLYDLPHLQYLILAEDGVRDLTPVGSLRELKWLEIFWTKAEDLSPLVNCTALRDLNISYVYARGDNAYAALSQMPWLERLWCCGSNMSNAQIDDLRAKLPDCEIFAERFGESTGGSWRYHPHYYEMRDAFEMYYMNSGEDSSAQPNSKLPAIG